MVGDVSENFWNLPNGITLLRIGLTPFLLMLPWFEGPTWSAIMGFGFLAISLTDLLDGYLARLHGTESRIGKLLDPLADKLLVMTAFVMLVAVDRIPPWALPLVIAILGREIAVTALRAMASAEGIAFGAAPLGQVEDRLPDRRNHCASRPFPVPRPAGRRSSGSCSWSSRPSSRSGPGTSTSRCYLTGRVPPLTIRRSERIQCAVEHE